MKTLFLASAAALSLSVSAATLNLGDNVRVVSINGKSVPAYASKIELDPGINNVTVRYDSLFEQDAESHWFIRSELHQLTFKAMGDEEYFLDAPAAESDQQGQMLANDPTFTLMDESDNRIDHGLRSHTELLNQTGVAGNQF
ncbi:DUF2057 domain-containing protein [Ferrimonas sediminicola]|uniref:DUF2057 domain-containing protein n=1 Tax=Ferrimonas sediminicola TaxID=2569538 RepID=A0A4U1B8G4_9GAMM|nr:DUF2057 family protein [Ferrimonas sediminicola]TKB46788.1 DUF2057 domain-containing protein [Ferrimonas sediminicola]